MNKEKMMTAIEAIRNGSPSEILDATAVLDDGERLCVGMVLELTAPPTKRKRSDAGVPRAKKGGAVMRFSGTIPADGMRRVRLAIVERSRQGVWRQIASMIAELFSS